MTYATSIAARSQKIRVLVKIAGVPGYLTDFDADTYDDSAGGNTHGSQTCYPHIVSASYSAGRLDHQRHRVTQSTLSLEVLDSAWLRGLLARRVAPDYVTEDVDGSETSITVVSGSGWTVAGYAHIGRETMSAENSGGTLTVTRGVLGTTAETHPTGTAIATTPRHWIGRKAWLVLGSNDGSGWTYQDPYRVFRISAAPSFVNGVWSFEFSDGLDIDERKLYSGFDDVTLSEYIIVQNAGGNLCTRFHLDDSAHFAESSDAASFPTSVLLDIGGMRGVFEVNDVDTGNDWVEVLHWSREFYSGRTLRDWLGEAWGEDNSALPDPDRVMTWNTLHPIDGKARPVYAMRDGVGATSSHPGRIALWCLLSKYGAASNSYDYLPGVAPAENVIERRAGAAFTTDEVDVTTFTALGQTAPSQGFVLGASGPMSVGEFLDEHICPVLGCYHYVTAAGKIALKSYDPSTASTSVDLTITDTNNIGGDNAVDDESAVIASVQVASGWSVADNDWRTLHVSHYVENDRVYGRTAQVVEINSQLCAADEASALAIGERLYARWGQGSERYSVLLPWSAHLVEPGDNVSLTNSRLPSSTSSTLGVSAKLCEVISVGPDFSRGQVRAELAANVVASLIAPCALVENDFGGTWGVSLQYGSSTLDAELPVGWFVRAIASSDGTLRAGEAEINFNNGSVMAFEAGITGLAVGDVLVLSDSDGTQDTALASYSGADQTDFAHIETAGGTITNRWA